jgi:carbamoyltransferase
LDLVVFYEKPFLKFERLLETYLSFAPAGLLSYLKAMPLWIKKKLWIKDMIAEDLGYKGKILFTEHHESHAASAFFPSPFEEAAVLTMDGVGEWATSSIAHGKSNRLEMLQELRFPHSLGLLYSAFTYYTGFKVNSGEYKVMGLAPYGEPKYKDLILSHLMDLKEDGSFKMNMEYFNYGPGLTMTSAKFHKLFGGPPRKPESKLTQREMDLARSVQEVTEEVMIRMARHARKVTGSRNLCLAGGVALNCVGNGRILREKIFDNIWIQPAAGDAGGALGAALYVEHAVAGNPRRFVMDRADWGRSNSPSEAADFYLSIGVGFEEYSDENRLLDRVAGLLLDGRVTGWVQGRFEWGPRALGHRSILADPRRREMKDIVNTKIKFREPFRPFAPSVPEERAVEFFDFPEPERHLPPRFMQMVAPVRADKQAVLPAVTHVDYSARIQTVDGGTQPRFERLLRSFADLTGCPLLVNTSFNVRGEPIVGSPADAFRCFMRTEMDALVIGNLYLRKAEQTAPAGDAHWKEDFALD